MPYYEFDWIDAFTLTPFGGNGCAVIHGADDLDPDCCTAIVRETGLVECAFVVTSDKADFGARYYLADREIPMAGHPTVATIRSLIHRGLVDLSTGRAELTLELGAGVMPIEVTVENDEPLITMTQARPVFGSRQEPATIAALYRLDAADIVGTPRIVSTGTPFCVTVLTAQSALKKARLDFDRLVAWRATSGESQAALLEPFLVTLGGATPDGDTFSRLLLAPPLPAEDPFTGAATGCMAAYLWAEGLIDAQRFIAEQGHWLGRPGNARVEVLGPQDDIAGVRVAGHGTVLMEGRLRL